MYYIKKVPSESTDDTENLCYPSPIPVSVRIAPATTHTQAIIVVDFFLIFFLSGLTSTAIPAAASIIPTINKVFIKVGFTDVSPLNASENPSKKPLKNTYVLASVFIRTKLLYKK